MKRNNTLNYYKAFIKKSKKLKKKQKEILIKRIEGDTLQKIADFYEIKSRERIRHLEANALYKLFRFVLENN